MSFGADGALYVGRDNTGSGGGNPDALRIHRIGHGGSPVAEFGNDAIPDPDVVIVDRTGAVSGIPGAVLVGGQISPGVGQVSRIAPDGTVTPLFGPSSLYSNPSGLALDSLGRLLFADSYGGRVYRSDGSTPVLLFNLADAYSIAADAADRIVVSRANNPGRLMLYSVDGALSNASFASVRLATPMARGPGGFWTTDLYAITAGSNLIRIALDGTTTTMGSGFGDIEGLTFGADGALYAGDFAGDRVWRIAPLPQPWTTNNLPSGLISWWNADGNTLDVTGVNPASSSGQTYEPGRFGQAFHFNGVNQSVAAPGSDSLDQWTQFTLEAWMKLDRTEDVAGGAPGRMVINRVGNATDHVNFNQGYQFGIWDNARRLVLNFNTNGQAWSPGGFATEAVLPASLPTNVWLHIAATYDHNAVVLFLNGVPLKTNVIGAATVAHSTSAFRIGMDDNGNCPFPGSIDDVRVYSRALSASEIASLAGEPGPVDFSDDFSAGVNSNLWFVGSNDPLYSLDASQGEIRFNRPAGGTYTRQTMALAFDREIRGDFDARVDFRNASINRVDGSPGNQVQLVAVFGDQIIIVVRGDEIPNGHNAHIFRHPPGSWTGEIATTATSGNFRITRVGAVVTASYNGTVLHSGSYNTAPVTQLYFHLQNNGTRDATSVVFDNFHLHADRIMPKAARLQTLGATGNPFQLRLLNPTPGTWNWIEHSPVLSATNVWSVRGGIAGGAFPTNWSDVLPLETPAGFFRVRSQ